MASRIKVHPALVIAMLQELVHFALACFRDASRTNMTGASNSSAALSPDQPSRTRRSIKKKERERPCSTTAVVRNIHRPPGTLELEFRISLLVVQS